MGESIDIELYNQAAKIITESGNPSLSLLRVVLNLNYDDAAKIMDAFVDCGFISDYKKQSATILSCIHSILLKDDLYIACKTSI